MEISRDRFIDHFAITFHVHCLRLWPKRTKEPPCHVSRCLHEWIGINSGHVPLTPHEFNDLIEPVIADVHRTTAKGVRPCSRELAGRVYDALSAANIEVIIRPPVHSHSTPS